MNNRHRIGNQALVREINLAMVMKHLRDNAPVSRATLSELTGLNKTTVSSLVQELLEYNFLRERGRSSTGAGRPAVLLEFNPDGGYIISSEIGVDSIAIICTNFVGQIIWQQREQTDLYAGQSEIVDRLLNLLQQASNAIPSGTGPLLGLSLGVPGLVDRMSGMLLFAPNLKWRDVPLRSMLESKFNVPIFVDNEANFAALGEHYFGAAKDFREVLFISVGVGLGGGIIRDGQLFAGATGFGGEFGHMTMDPDGAKCNCGNTGCWETQVSQAALFRYLRHAVQGEGRTSVLTQLAGRNLDQLTVPLVVQAASNGDQVALDMLQKIGCYLGIGIASLVNALNPNLIVFGGILSLAGDFLLPVISTEIHQRALPYLWGDQMAQVVIAQHGVDACVMGGVARCYEYILTQPGYAARQRIR